MAETSEEREIELKVFYDTMLDRWNHLFYTDTYAVVGAVFVNDNVLYGKEELDYLQTWHNVDLRMMTIFAYLIACEHSRFLCPPNLHTFFCRNEAEVTFHLNRLKKTHGINYSFCHDTFTIKYLNIQFKVDRNKRIKDVYTIPPKAEGSLLLKKSGF